MNRWIPWIVALLALVCFCPALRGPRPGPDGFDTSAFGHLPVQTGGRIKPFDTLARTSLMIFQKSQRVRQDGRKIGQNRWLLDVLFNAPEADKHQVFLIDNPDVLGLLNLQQEGRMRFSYAELSPFVMQIDAQGRQASEVEASKRSPYETSILALFNSLSVYQRLKDSIRPAGVDKFAAEIDEYSARVPGGFEAMTKRNAGQEYDKEALGVFSGMVERYEALNKVGYLRPVPPADDNPEWLTIGGALMAVSTDGKFNPVARAYAEIGDAVVAGDADTFNARVASLRESLATDRPDTSSRASLEFLFNRIDPFSWSMALYVLAFLLACGSWLGKGPSLRRTAFLLLVVAVVIHSLGLVIRMYLSGRPPVTNLYSSAIFIGWGTVLIGLFLERFFKDGIGTATAGFVGFITLVIAHHLAGSGDTMEMLQAVLDTNLWLATHVVTIAIGYSAMVLAGMLAAVYVIRGVFTRSLDHELDLSLGRMVYGVICFALLFSFVGTVLGGIWADQSWGRFWGWDPKENGALLIVLWCAIILHARWNGSIQRRGLMIMALFGNVITAFSWFGVNMLGVGLHSYGFMNKAFPWLIGFMISQLVLMAVAAIPQRMWASFRTAGNRPSASATG